jgi:peptide/nickel transport system ATP-binding protein
MSLIDVKNLSVAFKGSQGTATVVHDMSFSIQSGRVTAVVGESGSGKSVSALSIMGLLPETALIQNGNILYSQAGGSSVDLLRLKSSEMRKLRGREFGMIFQEPMTSLNPVFTCGNQVSEVLRLHLALTGDEARERCIELFRKVRLPDPERVWKAYPHELSGGQRQRVMIAMAIACKPSLLIADEPTTALDVSVQKSVLELLKELQTETGMGILFITHDLGVVKEIADDVVVMYRGELAETGSTDTIFHSASHAYTRGLLSCKPAFGVRLKRLPTVRDFIEKNELPEECKTEENTADRKLTHERLYRNEPMLQIRNLTKRYGSGIAVDAVSFDLYPGETLGLIGESGCGKTTLGRTVLRLTEPDSGHILFKGRNIEALTQSELRKMRKEFQLVFQDPFSSLNPRLKAGEAVEEAIRVHFPGYSRSQSRKRTLELFEMTGLKEDWYHRYPQEFSGGQRQRVCIARALAPGPSVLVCDESVSALDVSVQATILNLLNDLKKELGLSYLFISHDMSVIRYMSDRIMVMQKGRVIEMDEADKLCENPTAEYTQMLIRSIPG